MSSNADKFRTVLARHAFLAQTLAKGCDDPKEFALLSKEYSDLTAAADSIKDYLKVSADIADMEYILMDKAQDKEMRDLADQEIHQLRKNMTKLDESIRIMLLPKDEADEKSAIIEVRAGAGGEEAALFAGNLLNMYQRYAEVKGWKTEVISISDAEMGGVREAILNVKGKNVFALLKFESGTHRVQRVPATETQGRIHTSAATVAVLPEVEDIDVSISDKDIRVDTYRASGAGGQHVNKTESAIRITHLPTNIVVTQQDEKSQHKNRDRAMKILRARLYEYERNKRDSARAAERRSQVGTGDRSERIRTYNFPQGRVTDHRINLTLYKLDVVLMGLALDELIDALIIDHQANLLADLDMGTGTESQV
ncbi:MAG: peptide chain release factor 1 [Alphaproteobacteria bacterium]|nr:MAG: peptide chain release factor 1 [Alphaproteobacteria bacterium]